VDLERVEQRVNYAETVGRPATNSIASCAFAITWHTQLNDIEWMSALRKVVDATTETAIKREI
jgi:hypothetical protein